MSRKNGDRARADRQRREKLHKRARSRELRKAVQERKEPREQITLPAHVV